VVGLDTAELINIILVALLVGNDVAVWTVVHPALDEIPVEAAFKAERAMLLRYKTLVPFLILFILASGIAVVVQDDVGSASWWLSLAGTIAIFCWQLIVISLYPINVKIMEAGPEDVPDEEEWRKLRRIWLARHTARMILSIGALVVYVIAAIEI
jgi:ABC-type methionine transport system permease subunit